MVIRIIKVIIAVLIVFPFLPIEQTYAAAYPNKSVLKLNDSTTINYNFSFSGTRYVEVRKDGLYVTDDIGGSSSWTFKPTEKGEYTITIYSFDSEGERYSVSCNVKVYKHIIIYIPGIMGTELYVGSDSVPLSIK